MFRPYPATSPISRQCHSHPHEEAHLIVVVKAHEACEVIADPHHCKRFVFGDSDCSSALAPFTARIAHLETSGVCPEGRYPEPLKHPRYTYEEARTTSVRFSLRMCPPNHKMPPGVSVSRLSRSLSPATRRPQRVAQAGEARRRHRPNDRRDARADVPRS